MRAKFIGDPLSVAEQKNPPEEFEAHGLIFEKGKFTEVPDHLAAKFAGNSHFEVDEEPAKRGPGRPRNED